MGQQIDRAEWDETPRRTYPWRDWVDGHTWEVYQGEDFDVPVGSMQSILHQRARIELRRVRTQRVIRGGDGVAGIRFQFYVPGAAPARVPMPAFSGAVPPPEAKNVGKKPARPDPLAH